MLCFLLYSKSLSEKQEAERMNSHREKVKYEVQVPAYVSQTLRVRPSATPINTMEPLIPGRVAAHQAVLAGSASGR